LPPEQEVTGSTPVGCTSGASMGLEAQGSALGTRTMLRGKREGPRNPVNRERAHDGPARGWTRRRALELSVERTENTVSFTWPARTRERAERGVRDSARPFTRPARRQVFSVYLAARVAIDHDEPHYLVGNLELPCQPI
jgi:hypothetical protein